MLYRTIVRSLNRTIAPYASLVNATTRKEIIRKATTTTFRKHAAVVLGSRKLDHISHCQLSSQQELNINSIKNAFCKELSLQDVGEVVQVRGLVVHIQKGEYVIIKDKTGIVRLVIEDQREDLKDWCEKLEKYSLQKIIGIVRKKERKDVNITNGRKEEIEVVLSYVISSLPPTSNSIEKVAAGKQQEVLPNFMEELTTDNTVTSEKITKDRIGSNVQVFGWIKSIDEDRSFILSDAKGSITIAHNFGAENTHHEVQKLQIGDVVVVEGLVAEGAVAQYQASPRNKKGKLQITANFIKKLNGNNLLELRAPDVNSYTVRSHTCGELNASHAGQKVRLMGWVTFIRMNMFILLQDKYGLVQLTVSGLNGGHASMLKDLSLESVISVEGVVCLRPPGNENKNMKTGEIEVNLTDLRVINKAETLPFYLKDPRPSRPVQLQYGYLDLRQHPGKRTNLEFRSDVLLKMRRFLIERVGFLEVETPTLFMRTPGGAQEFVVPTRKKGEFYALVQSPQQFKQLLMVGGQDRYFQIARCYRDEESQKDRQPEFTQLDIEMSFCDREGVIKLIEDVIKFVWPKNFSPIKFPFPRMTYEEAMSLYGTDKPDMRFDWKINDLTDIFKQAGKSCGQEINMETYMDVEDFAAVSLVVPKVASYFPIVRQLVQDVTLDGNCKIFTFKLENAGTLDTILNKLFLPPLPEVLGNLISHEPGDVAFLGFGRRNNLLKSVGKLRTVSAKISEERGIEVYAKNRPFNFLWVVDFPLFEEEGGVTCSVHHPFTQPHPDDLKLVKTDPLKVRGLHYDLVLNGNEIGGGSIRIHDSQLQREVLEDILKLDKSYFQHLLDALSYGAPTHGGFALGIDRFIALLRGTTSILDVIAFPKYSTGRDPLTGAPTDIPKEDKDLYHIQKDSLTIDYNSCKLTTRANTLEVYVQVKTTNPPSST